MVRVLFVHGMNHENRTPQELRLQWYPCFIETLKRARTSKERIEPLPEIELELLYWGDFFNRPAPDTYPLQGVSDDLAKAYYDFVRRATLLIDRLTKYDPLARPSSFVARRINAQVRQTAMYMANAPIERLEDSAQPNVYDQIQYRFRRKLDWKPDIVIGHSLGSVIAYEGLCQSARRVPVLLTLGSPIGVPGLIYDKLRPAESKPRSAPNVREWVNVSNLADPMVVPVPEIAPLFREPVRDVVFERGKPGLRSLVINHKFVEYLKDERVGAVIADAFDAVAAERGR